MSSVLLTVSTPVKLPISTVWEIFTNPQHIEQWNAASDDWHCPKAVNDLREGGKFSYTMASRDGNVSFNFEGVYTELLHPKKISYIIPEGEYTEIREGEKISYTVHEGRTVEVIFTENKDSTTITEIFDTEPVHSLEQQQAGWQAILENFKRYAEGLQ
ncbi:MAG: SRPBCC domain-containing protein [Candidatus Peregrinibacteria bacterium]